MLNHSAIWLRQAVCVGGVAEAGGAGRHRLEHARLPLHPQVARETALGGDEPHQRRRLLGVAVVREEAPTRVGVGGDGAGDVVGAVRRGPGRPERRGEYRAGGDVAIGAAGGGAVADVRVFAPLGATGAQRLGRGGAFAGLDPGHRVGADDMATQHVQQRGVGVAGAAGLHLLGEGEGSRLLGLGGAPVAATLGLQLGLQLRSAPPCGEQCWRRCPA